MLLMKTRHRLVLLGKELCVLAGVCRAALDGQLPPRVVRAVRPAVVDRVRRVQGDVTSFDAYLHITVLLRVRSLDKNLAEAEDVRRPPVSSSPAMNGPGRA